MGVAPTTEKEPFWCPERSQPCLGHSAGLGEGDWEGGAQTGRACPGLLPGSQSLTPVKSGDAAVTGTGLHLLGVGPQTLYREGGAAQSRRWES